MAVLSRIRIVFTTRSPSFLAGFWHFFFFLVCLVLRMESFWLIGWLNTSSMLASRIQMTGKGRLSSAREVQWTLLHLCEALWGSHGLPATRIRRIYQHSWLICLYGRRFRRGAGSIEWLTWGVIDFDGDVGVLLEDASPGVAAWRYPHVLHGSSAESLGRNNNIG